MNLEIVEIRDRGKLELERLILRATADIDLGEHALFAAYGPSGRVTTYVIATFWFPDVEVKAGDEIVVRSGVGDTVAEQREDGTSVRSFYWNRQAPVWADEKYLPVLLLVAEWKPFRARQASNPVTPTETAKGA